MAAGHLPTLTLTSYNSYVFPYDIETTSYRVEPLYDPAGRTVFACKFAISLHWFDSDLEGRGGSLEARSRDMVSRLTKNGGELKYESRGFGNPPVVNGGSRVRDTSWGPRPGPLELKPHGGTTVECSWSVEFTLPTCDDGVFNGIAWFAYSLQFARDSQGYSTRVYSAKLRIAQTKPTVDSRLIVDSADRYLEVITPALLPEFRRESANRTLSEDKSELSLTVVDVEMPPAAPPPGVVEADVSHSYSSKGLAQFVGVISARYTIPKGGDVRFALFGYYLLVADRLARAAKMSTAPGAIGLSAEAAAALPGKVSVFPIAFTCEEVNAYGRTEAKISLTYQTSGVFFNELLVNGGLWAPVPKGAGGDWKAWSASVPNTFSPRGFANLKFMPGEDRLLDLCRESPPVVPGSTVATRFSAAVSRGASLDAAVAAAFAKPSPSASWLEYSPRVMVVADTGRVPVTTLPAKPLSSAPRQNAQGSWDAYKGPLPVSPTASDGLIPGAQLAANVQNSGETVVQQRTKPNFYVVFTGTAMRAHYPIPCPELLTVNGKKPTLVGQPQFETFTAPGSVTPITCARWAQVYLFTDDAGGAPATIGPAPTPLA